MDKRNIPTILGILVLIIGIAAGVLLVESRRIFRLGATPELRPKNVRITNVSDNSITVSWTTDKEARGFIKWGENSSAPNKTATDTISVSGFTHSVTINALAPLTTYFFNIYSNGEEFDNVGIPWQVKTGPKLTSLPTSSIVFGSVLTPTAAPAKNTLVYAFVGGGSLLSSVTAEDGSWIIPISATRTQSLSSYIVINETSTLVEISVQAGPLGVASAQIYPAAARPVPPIILGQVYDFKNLPPAEPGEIPKASVGLPKEPEAPSGFQVNGQAPSAEETVSLDSVEEGEIVANANLEFFGEGPPGVTLTITVESEPITEQIIVDNSGNWKLVLVGELSEGIHKIIINWRDASGILRTLSRNFTVQAAAHPTATPTPTPTLTPSPTPTATAIPTPKPTTAATGAAIPDAGTLTPTILLSIMGLGPLVFGVLHFALSFDKSKG